MSALALTYGRREWVLELLLLLAEGMLVWMVAAVAFGPFSSLGDPVSPVLAVGLVAVAGILPRLLHDYGIWGGRFSAVVMLAIAITTLSAVKIVAFPGMPWLDRAWLREGLDSLVLDPSSADISVWAPIGLSAAVWWLAHFNGPPGLERCRATLRTGATVAAVSSLASALVETGPNDRAISLGVVVFFGATLVALAIARQGSEVTHSHARLLSTVLLPTVAIVSIAAVFALLVTFDWSRAVPHAPSLLGTVLDPVFQVLLLVLTGLVILISLPILWLFSLSNYDPPRVNEFTGTGQYSPAQSALNWHPPDPVRYLLAGIFLVVIFAGIARFGLAITRRDTERGETGERVFGSGKGIGRWLERIRWPFGRGEVDPLAGLRGDPAWAHTVRVRETYGAWLRWAEQRQLGRSAAETAVELDQRSSPFLQSPASASALDELTAIYDDVRYGGTPATAEQADRAAQLWRELRANESSTAKTV
ncbi:MAG TPA: DUF4129 domain-containing protein [Thermomicrobiales bacterium]|nr:DUF4129 domain-containing protein [Thermomicrobiales bacterium]